jgi:hypothetical protein
MDKNNEKTKIGTKLKNTQLFSNFFIFSFSNTPLSLFKIFVLYRGAALFMTFSKKKTRGPDKKTRKRGSEHKNYKHGLGKTRGWDSDRYASWKEGVLQRDNFCCFVTGKRNKNLLVCHHLNSWDIHPDQKYDIYNGITLTKEIHRSFRREYGAGKNTKEQFERFLQEKYNIFQYPWQHDNHEPILSIEEIEARRASQLERQKQAFLLLIEERGHQLLLANDGFYNSSRVEIYCLQHETVNQTTIRKYRYCKTGLRCCRRQAQSNKGTWKHVNDARRCAREEKNRENEL